VNILITNDDGINSEGLRVLAEALRELGEVFIVAPDRQRSAVGLSITLERPLRVERVDERTFSVDGMPADCVTLAIHRLMGSPPDFIASGINHGQNLGYDIYHSGTVGAALVGTMFGIPSMAVSIASWTQDMRHETSDMGQETVGGKSEVSGLKSQVSSLESSKDVVWYDTAAPLLNVNVPNVSLPEIEGIEVTRHCNATYDVEVHHRLDPRGRKYYWLGGEFQGGGDHSETDLDALHRRKVSVTPLRLDLTDYALMRELPNWILDSDQ